MSALVQVRGDTVMASSLDVASSFDKRHADVLRSISTLLKVRSDLERNFALLIDSYEAGKGSTRQRHHYEMDRKGFTLLAMGFTGPKALEWKIAFIDAFDRMEAALRAVGNDDDDDGEGELLPVSRSDGRLPFVERMKFEPPNIQLAYVREMRMAKGRPGAIMAMRDLGWESDVSSSDPAQVIAASDPVARIVLDWVRERTEPAPGHRIRVMSIYNDFTQWCVGRAIDVLTLKSFSMALASLGYQTRRADVSYKVGLKLRGG